MSNKKVQKVIVYVMIATMVISTVVIGISTLF
ncbi:MULTISPECIES: stressosome-associated protein Prli42 [Sporosarcina]|nr:MULTISPECIES: stressosome-associated protein Prli42 [Sporosarcina]WJY28408.1 stressosome-associated protein Prli42 [Sporosarcina sp. 0.2-SM1T-5]